jgi:hypothetical protein
MTALYRTPNIIIDAHEWHVIVRKVSGRTLVSYRWRPLSTRTYKWLSVASWKGPRPHDMWKFFKPYKRHIALATGCETRRREAILAMRGPPSGAAVRNVGTRVTSEMEMGQPLAA